MTELARDPFPLRGRVALVTGASRRAGIGYAICRRLAAYGASVYVHHFSPHDAEQPWGADDVAAVVDGVREVASAPVAHGSTALGAPDEARWITGQVLNTEGGFRR